MPGIRKSAPDHRPSWLLVQEALVLLILCILCIDVQSVENQFDGTCHKLAIANIDPLFHSRMIRTAGQARRSTGEFVQSLGVARGYLAELETFLTLSTKLEMTTPEQCKCLLEDCAAINKMLNAMIKSLTTPR